MHQLASFKHWALFKMLQLLPACSASRPKNLPRYQLFSFFRDYLLCNLWSMILTETCPGSCCCFFSCLVFLFWLGSSAPLDLRLPTKLEGRWNSSNRAIVPNITTAVMFLWSRMRTKLTKLHSLNTFFTSFLQGTGKYYYHSRSVIDLSISALQTFVLPEVSLSN